MSRTTHVASERAAWLKRRAEELGFTSVGISVARELTEEAPRMEAWLKQGMHGDMTYMEGNFDKRRIVKQNSLVLGGRRNLEHELTDMRRQSL